MDHPDRNVAQLANDIQDALAALRRRESFHWAESLRHPLERLQRLLRIHHRLRLCQVRGYSAAARHLHDQAVRLLAELIGEIQAVQQANRRRPAAVPSLRDLAAEIRQLRQEFGGYEYDRPSKTLRVITGPIQREGIALGRVRIDLHLAALATPASRDVYGIEALEPPPAATDSGATHPRASHGRLCEGEASAPIRSALQEGRICDFFRLVRSLLQTCNAHASHVPPNNRQGRPCHDCGRPLTEDNRYICESCDRPLCEKCIGYCRRCDLCVCNGCLLACPHCQDLRCQQCIEACAGCHQLCCPWCLEEGQCPACRKKREGQDHQQEV